MMQTQFGREGYRRFSEPLLCMGRNGVNVMGRTVIETESERLHRESISQEKSAFASFLSSCHEANIVHEDR